MIEVSLCLGDAQASYSVAYIHQRLGSTNSTLQYSRLNVCRCEASQLQAGKPIRC